MKGVAGWIHMRFWLLTRVFLSSRRSKTWAKVHSRFAFRRGYPTLEGVGYLQRRGMRLKMIVNPAAKQCRFHRCTPRLRACLQLLYTKRSSLDLYIQTYQELALRGVPCAFVYD